MHRSGTGLPGARLPWAARTGFCLSRNWLPTWACRRRPSTAAGGNGACGVTGSAGTCGSASGTWRNGSRPGRYDRGQDLQALRLPKTGTAARTRGWSATARPAAGPAASASSPSATTCARPRTSRSRSSTTSAPASSSTRRRGGRCSATRPGPGWTSTSARTPASPPTGRCSAPTSTPPSAASRSAPSAARTSRRSSPRCTARACPRAGSAAPTWSSARCSPRPSGTRSSPSLPAPASSCPASPPRPTSSSPPTRRSRRVAAGLPPDWAATVWLMHGCGLRIGEALAVNLRCRINRGTTLRVREQVNPAAQLRPLKFRQAGEFRDIPLPEYVSEAIDKHVAEHGTTPRRVPVPGPQVQARHPPQLPGGLPARRRQGRAAAGVHPALAAPPLRLHRPGRGHPDHRGLPLARPQEHRGHPPDLRPPRPRLLRPRPHHPRRRLPEEPPPAAPEDGTLSLNPPRK